MEILTGLIHISTADTMWLNHDITCYKHLPGYHATTFQNSSIKQGVSIIKKNNENEVTLNFPDLAFSMCKNKEH